MSYNSHHKSRERRARNSAGAEALAVARRLEEASRERNPIITHAVHTETKSNSSCSPTRC